MGNETLDPYLRDKGYSWYVKLYMTIIRDKVSNLSKRYMTMHKGIKIGPYLKGQAWQPDSIYELLFWACSETTPFGSTLFCYLYERPIIGQRNWSHQLQPRFKIAVMVSLIVDFACIGVNLKKKKNIILGNARIQHFFFLLEQIIEQLNSPHILYHCFIKTLSFCSNLVTKSNMVRQ